MSLTLKLYNIKHMYLVTFLYFSSLGFVALCFYLDFEFRCAFLSSQVVLVVKNPPASTGDLGYVGVISGLGRSPGGGHGNPLQYSCLENLRTEEPGGLQSIGSQRVGHN